MCKCNLCERSRVWKAIIDSRDVDKLIDLIYDMADHIENLELDNEVYQATLAGTWPGCTVTLEEALAKAKEFDDDNQ